MLNSLHIRIRFHPLLSGVGTCSVKVTVDAEGLARFEVNYQFSRGRPSRHYLCEVAFPGTPNQGAKPMEKWELRPEGVIRDGIQLRNPPVTDFEIRLSEAESPQTGYKLISNVLRGKVE